MGCLQECTSGIVGGGEPVVPLASIEALREFHAAGSDQMQDAYAEDLINLQPAVNPPSYILDCSSVHCCYHSTP